MGLTGAQWVHCIIYRHNLLASLVLRPSHYPVTSCSMEKWRGKADIVDYTNDYLDGQRSNDLKAFLCSVGHTIAFLKSQ